MLSKAELEALAEKYEAKAARAFQNYQETGISRYDREHRNADDLASAMRMAAQASDDYNSLSYLRVEVSLMAGAARTAMSEPEEKRSEAMEVVLKDLVSMAVRKGLIRDDRI